MSKPIIISHSSWMKLRDQLKKDYPPSVLLIRDKMRKVLGFVDREHRSVTDDFRYQTQLCLDFYDEPKKTMFLLKYSDYIDSTSHKDS